MAPSHPDYAWRDLEEPDADAAVVRAWVEAREMLAEQRARAARKPRGAK